MYRMGERVLTNMGTGMVSANMGVGVVLLDSGLECELADIIRRLDGDENRAVEAYQAAGPNARATKVPFLFVVK